jgi:hypothetical protein
MFSADSPHGEDIRHRVHEQARAAAVHAGADPATVAVTDIEESTVPHVSESTVLLRVRAEGPPRIGWRRTYERT